MRYEFIPFEQSLALKQLGFDEPCFGWYSSMEGNMFRLNYCETYLGIENCVKAPIFSQAFRFFREKYGIYVVIDIHKSSGYGLDTAFYYNIKIPINQMRFDEITNIHNDTEISFRNWINEEASKTYEEAELVCLKKIIKKVKINYERSVNSNILCNICNKLL